MFSFEESEAFFNSFDNWLSSISIKYFLQRKKETKRFENMLAFLLNFHNLSL